MDSDRGSQLLCQCGVARPMMLEMTVDVQQMNCQNHWKQSSLLVEHCDMEFRVGAQDRRRSIPCSCSTVKHKEYVRDHADSRDTDFGDFGGALSVDGDDHDFETWYGGCDDQRVQARSLAEEGSQRYRQVKGCVGVRLSARRRIVGRFLRSRQAES